MSPVETSAYQKFKLAVVAASHLSKDAIHIYLGLAVFLAGVLLLRRPLRSFVPLLPVLGLAIAMEALDRHDDLIAYGHWRVGASLHDIVNTCLWPAILVLLVRLTGLERPRSSGGDGAR
ncbi:MAG: hypothetical protein U0X73_06320 [Thermoanaerobaculia bacterium]